jgi:hypothetical protein
MTYISKLRDFALNIGNSRTVHCRSNKLERGREHIVSGASGFIWFDKTAFQKRPLHPESGH